jgi:hypothetical protein
MNESSLPSLLLPLGDATETLMTTDDPWCYVLLTRAEQLHQKQQLHHKQQHF